MKTYLRKLKSGNYEVANESNFTHEFENEDQLSKFFSNLSFENSTTYNSKLRKFKKAQIIKNSYSRSQTYFNSFGELLKSLTK